MHPRVRVCQSPLESLDVNSVTFQRNGKDGKVQLDNWGKVTDWRGTIVLSTYCELKHTCKNTHMLYVRRCSSAYHCCNAWLFVLL